MWRKIVNQRGINSFLATILIVGFSILLTGCLNLAGDVTPPPDINQTQPVKNTPVPTLEPTWEEPQPEETAPQDLDTGTIMVEVFDHSGGTLLAQNLEVRLEGFDHFDPVYHDTYPLLPDGVVEFTEVPYQAGRLFFASIAYGGAVYRSEITEFVPEGSSLILQVEIFETTTDASHLSVDRIHVLVDYPQPDMVQIGEVIILSNYGDATVVAEAAGLPAVSFPLPDGATAIEFENGALGQRYLQTQDGFGDTVSIPPGAGVYQVLVYFALPYQNNKLEFIQNMNYPVEAVVVLMPVGDMVLKGENLEELGIQTLQDGTAQVYSSGELNRGEQLQFEISGKSEIILPEVETSSALFQNYWIGLAVLGAGMFLTGIWLLIRNRKSGTSRVDPEEQIDARNQILDSIIALEDLFQRGDITKETFQKKRDQLKGKLKSLTQGEKFDS
jgi:hypothetical protein